MWYTKVFIIIIFLNHIYFNLFGIFIYISCLAPEVVMSNTTTSNKNHFSILSPSSTDINDNNITEEQKQQQPFSPSSNFNCIMDCQGHGRPADLWSTGKFKYMILYFFAYIYII